MNTKVTAEQPNGLDTVKLGLALAILVAAVAAFHYFADAPKLARIGGVIAAVAVAATIAAFTHQGRQLTGFIREAQIEVRKVVWPTRQETTQTTLIVLIVVVIFAFMLWLLDLMLGALVQSVIGHGA
jgi:preprotein translocase subunit SecE